VQTDYNLFLMTEKAKLQDTLTLKIISYTIYLTHFMKKQNINRCIIDSECGLMTNYTYVSPQHGTERPETYNHIHVKLYNTN